MKGRMQKISTRSDSRPPKKRPEAENYEGVQTYVSVRQARRLPPTSFRFGLATDTIVFGCALPAIGRAKDLHLLD